MAKQTKGTNDPRSKSGENRSKTGDRSKGGAESRERDDQIVEKLVNLYENKNFYCLIS